MQQKNSCLLTITRIPAFNGWAQSYIVCIDEEDCGVLKNKGQVSVFVSPGRHRVAFFENQHSFFGKRKLKTLFNITIADHASFASLFVRVNIMMKLEVKTERPVKKSVWPAIKGFLIFAAFFLLCDQIGSAVFPTDEATNTLIAPDWYPIASIVFPLFMVFLFSQNRYQKIWRWAKRLKWRVEHRIDPFGKRKHKPDDKVDAMYDKAVLVVLETGMPYATVLQEHLNISFANAIRLLEQLQQNGIVDAPEDSPAAQGSVNEAVQPEQSAGIDAVDHMEGHDFEYWCADLLRKSGFKNVEVTRGSGDQGVDVLAEKDDIRYAIQCKCYSSNLGNTPVQEVHAGMGLYKCHIGVVMTNRYFTAGAKELASATNVLLWDRDKLAAMLDNVSTSV